MRAWKGIWLAAVIACASLPALPLAADEDQAPQTYPRGVARKLGRGIANVVTAPLELIRVPYLTSHREGGLAGLSVGIVQGTWSVLVRELAGAVEVATFLIPIPRRFQPVVRPEFVYAHGDWSP